MPYKPFQYKPNYQLPVFNLNNNVQPQNKFYDAKSQQLYDMQQKKLLEEKIRENYLNDLNDLVTQGHEYPITNRIYRKDETPFVLRQFDRQIPKSPFYKAKQKNVKKRATTKNKYFN